MVASTGRRGWIHEVAMCLRFFGWRAVGNRVVRRRLAAAGVLFLVASCANQAEYHWSTHSRHGDAGDAGIADGGDADADRSRADGGADASHGDARASCVGGSCQNPIVAENSNPGTVDWGLDMPALNHEVEGYASVVSAVPGDSVTLYVSVSKPHAVSWQLYRLGYYAGLGGRLRAKGAVAAVPTQPSCPVDPTTGMVECAWQPTLKVDLGADCISGQYVFKLVRDDGFQSYVPLLVREGTPRAPLLVETNVTTWQAYNAWGGTSLYANSLPADSAFTGPHAYRVSFDRPYADYSQEGQLPLADTTMLRWLEMKGYDLAYTTGLDIDREPHVLDGRKLFLVAGHDEYWTVGERDAIEASRDSGVSLAFFAANTGYWRIRLGPSTSGTNARTITCYKSATLDPQGTTREATARFRDDPFSRPENGLIGGMYVGVTRMGGFPMVVTNPSHWAYRGTSVVAGETLSHLVGYEWDAVGNNSVSPPSLEVLAHSDAFARNGESVASDMTVYYPTPSSIVFSAGGIQWPYGLGVQDYADARVARITENVLARSGLPTATPTQVVPQPAADVGDATSVTLIAGAGTPGYADGPAASAQFDAPAGIAADPSGILYVTEARNHRVRKIDLDGTVSTLAGCGPSGVVASKKFRDGKGSLACFNTPTGIAVGPDGRIFVSDTNNGCIRAITPDGLVTTFAGSGGPGSVDAADPLLATFSGPRGLAFAPDGSLYVVDGDSMTLRRITATGVTTVAQGTEELSGVAVAPDGTVYGIASGGFDVWTLSQGTLVPIAGNEGEPGDLPGFGTHARLRPAEGLVVSHGALIVADTQNYKVRRISVSPEHTVTTLAGNGMGGQALGTGATANIENPRGIAVTAQGYAVADSGNDRIVLIRP
jgi:sugar lactone lactonase YvrE